MKKQFLFVLLLLTVHFIYSSSTNELSSKKTTILNNGEPIVKSSEFLDFKSNSLVNSNNITLKPSVLLEKLIQSDGSEVTDSFSILNSTRVTIETSDSVGARISLLDKVNGRIAESGLIGSRNGRIDIELDKGDYRVISRGKESTSYRVLVTAFTELNSKSEEEFFLNAEPGAYLEQSLTDKFKRSYWLYSNGTDPIFFEALGKYLDSLTIYKDGIWKIDTVKRSDIREVNKGQPQTFVEYSNILDEGYYLVVANGGQGLKWASEDNNLENKFYVRSTPYRIDNSDFKGIKVSPFGRDSFLVSNKSSFFVATPQDISRELNLNVTSFNPGRSKYSRGKRSSLNIKEYANSCYVSGVNISSDFGSLVIETNPGSNVTLGAFKGTSSDYSRIREKSDSDVNYFINSFIPVANNDSLDLTPFLYNNERNNQVLVKSTFVPLSSSQPILREYNLNNNGGFILSVLEDGNYTITEIGGNTYASASYAFLSMRDLQESEQPKNYVTGDTVSLKKGAYVVTIYGQKRGIHKFALYKKPITAFTTSLAEKYVESLFDTYSGDISIGFNWPSILLNHTNSSSYSIEYNNKNYRVENIIPQPAENLDSQRVALVLPGKDRIEFSFIGKKGESLDITGENIVAYDSNGLVIKTIKSGVNNIILENSGDKNQLLSLGLVKNNKKALVKVPNIKELKNSIEVIGAGSKKYVDFERRETKSYILKVDKLSLYNIETEGRLRTGVNVRTESFDSLFKVSENGVGRNSKITSFLRPGEYLIEVSTIGNSKGRAAISLKESEFIVSDEISNGDISRLVVPDGVVVKYPIEIKEDGRYKFSTLLYKSTSKLRLEDSKGWPLFTDIDNSSTDLFLEKGSYTYYSMPKNVQSRRVTSLDLLKETSSDYLKINDNTDGIWLENEGREPKSYKFDFNADQSGYISFSKDFEGWIRSSSGEELYYSNVGKIEFSLGRGGYTFELRPIDIDNKKSYRISSRVNEISMAYGRSVPVPGKYDISIGEDSYVELFSFGGIDSEAYLYKDGNFIDQNDDIDGDWNFKLSNKLKKGKYTLELRGKSSGYTNIRVNELEEESYKIAKLPFNKSFKVQNRVLEFEFEGEDSVKPLIVETQSGKVTELTLYKNGTKIASGVESLNIPIGKGPYLLQVLVNSREEVDLNIQLEYPEYSLNDFGFNGEINFKAAIFNNRDGVNYFLSGDSILYSPGEDIPFKKIENISYSTKNGNGYVLSEKSVIGTLSTKPLTLTMGYGEIIDIDSKGGGFLIDSSNDKSSKNRSNIALLKAISVGSNIGVVPIKENLNWDNSYTSVNGTYLIVPNEANFTGHIWNGSNNKVRGSLKLENYNVSNIYSIDGPGLYNIDSGNAAQFKVLNSNLGLTVSRGSLVSFWSETKPLKTIYAESDSLTLNIPNGTVNIYTINLSNSLGLISVGSRSITDRDAEINNSNYFEGYKTSGGLDSFNISLQNMEKLQIFGSVNSIKVLNNSGEYSEIEGFNGFREVDIKSGKVIIDYNSGLLSLWGSEVKNRFSDFGAGFIKTESSGYSELLEGSNKLNNFTNIWTLNLSKPQYVSIKTPLSSVLTILDSEESVVLTDSGLFPTGSRVNYYLQPGEYRVICRGINSQAISGELLYQTKDATNLFEGGLEGDLFIKKGDDHLYKFTVSERSKVGFGIESDKDILDLTLYNSDFELIKYGPLGFITLDKGDYFLVVDSPIDTVRYRPVVYGINGSKQSIPESELNKYR